MSLESTEQPPAEARILALDLGARRIGLAVSDPLGVTAQGLPTLHRTNKRTDLRYLQDVVRRYAIREIVIGLPLPLSGTPGTQAEKANAFAADLRKHFALPVHLWDERLTSAQANRLLRETDMSIRRRGQVVDQMSAVLILQSFLDHRHTR